MRGADDDRKPIFSELLTQLEAIPPSKPAPIVGRPRGEIRKGGTTEAVLAYLKTYPGFRTEAQIRWALNRSHASVSWALLFLVKQKLIRAVPDAHRNSRYQRYAAVREQT